MAIEVTEHKGRWRLVDTETGRLARAGDGSLLDKGGYPTREQAQAAANPAPQGMGGGFRGGQAPRGF